MPSSSDYANRRSANSTRNAQDHDFAYWTDRHLRKFYVTWLFFAMHSSGVASSWAGSFSATVGTDAPTVCKST